MASTFFKKERFLLIPSCAMSPKNNHYFKDNSADVLIYMKTTRNNCSKMLYRIANLKILENFQKSTCGGVLPLVNLQAVGPKLYWKHTSSSIFYFPGDLLTYSEQQFLKTSMNDRFYLTYSWSFSLCRT